MEVLDIDTYDDFTFIDHGKHLGIKCHNRDVTDIRIPSSVLIDGAPCDIMCIGDDAFEGCTSLVSVTIPHTVDRIEEGVFYGCSSLAHIEVDPDNGHFVSVDGVLYSKDMTVLLRYPSDRHGDSYTIPGSVTAIG